MTHGPRVHIHSAGQWYRLPAYITAVFEGALRNGKPLASVQLTGRLGMYLVANLEDWRNCGRVLKGRCFFPLLVMGFCFMYRPCRLFEPFLTAFP